MLDPARLESLLNDCARGQEAALAELYKLTSPHLFALATRMLKRRDSAEEVLQECFISIWRHAASFSAERSQAMTWMTRIVRNRCLDQLRRPDFERPDPDGAIEAAWADDAPGPIKQLEASQEGKRLAACMGQLESKQRIAIALSFFDDLSHSQIAARLGAPLGTVKSWLSRGMDRLKRCLS